MPAAVAAGLRRLLAAKHAIVCDPVLRIGAQPRGVTKTNFAVGRFDEAKTNFVEGGRLCRSGKGLSKGRGVIGELSLRQSAHYSAYSLRFALIGCR